MHKKSRSGPTGQIRIIGGQWRGRKLPVPNHSGLRPTTDRIRETLFNWLAPSLQEARCLDCFAGSGALGFEALSRYAGTTTLLELASPVAQQLERNLALLKADHGRIVNTDTLHFLTQAGEPYDVVFIDPPFRQNMLAQTVLLLEQQGWLSDEALIYIESEAEKGLPVVPTNWHLHREKIAGQVACRLYQRHHNVKESGNVA
ncbi:16S rRNA (guanine(966)-N(2))-methyltransferase [Enterobacteriaceae bacterium LUAb1]